MHEMAIAEGIQDIALTTAADNGAARVLEIKLQIGQMSGIEPDSLQFCFEVLSAGTPTEGARLIIEITPLVARCDDCGGEFRVERFSFFCPACGSAKVETISGRELRVEHLEVE